MGLGSWPGLGGSGGLHFDETPPSVIGPSRLPKAISAVESTGATAFKISAPSFGGMRVSLGYGEPSIMSPTAAIVTVSFVCGAGVGVTLTSTSVSFVGGSVPATGPQPVVEKQTDASNERMNDILMKR